MSGLTGLGLWPEVGPCTALRRPAGSDSDVRSHRSSQGRARGGWLATSFPGRDFGEIFPRWWFWPDRSLSSFCPGLVALLMFRSHARSDCRPGPGRPTAHRGPLRPGSGPRRGGASRPPWPGISVARRPRGAAAGPAGRPPEFAGVQSWRHPFPMQHPQDGAGGTLEVHSDPPEAGAPVPHPPHRLHLVGPELPRRPQDLPPALSPRPWRNRRASSCCTPGWNGKSIPSCQGEINRVSQPPPQLRHGGIPSRGRKQGCFQPWR